MSADYSRRYSNIVSLVFIYVISNAATILIYEVSKGGSTEAEKQLALCISALDEIDSNGWKSATRAARGLRILEQQALAHARLAKSQTAALPPSFEGPATLPYQIQPPAPRLDDEYFNFLDLEQKYDVGMNTFDARLDGAQSSIFPGLEVDNSAGFFLYNMPQDAWMQGYSGNQ